MYFYPPSANRPGIATFFGLVSLLWALSTLAGTLVMLGLVALGSAASWLGGPIIGAAGSAIGLLIGLYLFATSFLSFLLLSAGWLTLKGDPRGIERLRTWAWISLVLDVVAILVSSGLAANGYFGVGFAVAVLYFTTPAEVRMRWMPPEGGRPWAAKEKYVGDPDF